MFKKKFLANLEDCMVTKISSYSGAWHWALDGRMSLSSG
jgi:hypothetical protein